MEAASNGRLLAIRGTREEIERDRQRSAAVVTLVV